MLKPLLNNLILISLFSLSAYAQKDAYLQSPEDGLQAASSDYKKGKYEEAFRKYTALTEKFPEDIHSSSFQFMAAKSLYMAKDYNGAASHLRDFISIFPISGLMDEAGLYLGHALFRGGDYYEAAGQYLLVIEGDPKSEAAQIARENLSPLIRHGLTISELRRLIQENPGSSVSEIMEFSLARREIDAGHSRRGISVLKAFMRRYPGSRDFKQAKALLEQASKKSEGQLEIGLLVPATGNYQEYGRSMIEGAQLAIKDIPENSLRIELSVKDTQGDPILAARMANDISQEEPVAVVGPLRSESAISAAIVLNEREIPMITPTASEDGLAEIGPNIFQLSSPIGNIGSAMAQYAVEVLEIKDFAIIAPDDAGGSRIANAFARRVYELGGDVILTSYYSPGMTDFKQQIMPLRDVLLVKTESLLQSGVLDTADFWDHKKDTLLAMEDWPVSIGGLFLPGYFEDLKQLIPQLKYHVIKTRFLGGDGWDSEDLIREVRQYIDDAIFATDFHTEADDPEWMQFTRSYALSYNRPPDKVAAMTYDAIRLIVSGILDGNRNPEDMRHYLSHVENYQGVSGTITFKGTNRANNGVAVFSIDGKRLAGAK
jgi:ABC-type branched-subunit amino acid transport system substrate-binding protein